MATPGRSRPLCSPALRRAPPTPFTSSTFSSFSSASTCFCLFFSTVVVIVVFCGAAIPLAGVDLSPPLPPPPQLFLLHSAFPFLPFFSDPYFLLSLPSLPPSPSFLLWSFLSLPKLLLLLLLLQLQSPPLVSPKTVSLTLPIVSLFL